MFILNYKMTFIVHKLLCVKVHTRPFNVITENHFEVN